MEEKELSTRIPMKRRLSDTEREQSANHLSKLDRLFESEWDVLVVRRDLTTGEFTTETTAEVSAIG